jgi:hypothetical protein
MSEAPHTYLSPRRPLISGAPMAPPVRFVRKKIRNTISQHKHTNRAQLLFIARIAVAALAGHHNKS